MMKNCKAPGCGGIAIELIKNPPGGIFDILAHNFTVSQGRGSPVWM